MNRLKELRKKNKLTVRELAEKVNISYPTISRLENEETSFTSDYLRVLSSFFNVSIDYLLGISPLENNIKINEHTNQYPEKYNELFQEISLLPESDLDLIKSVVKNLLDRNKIDYEELYKSKASNK